MTLTMQARQAAQANPMNAIVTIAANLREEYQLSQQFGFLSCIDYPKQYDRMDALQTNAFKLAEALTDNMDVLPQRLIEVLTSVAADQINELSILSKITFYDQEGFIDYIAASSMRNKEAERFKDMLQWMNEKDRAGYIETRFILPWENDRNNKKSFYYDDRMSFVIVLE